VKDFEDTNKYYTSVINTTFTYFSIDNARLIYTKKV